MSFATVIEDEQPSLVGRRCARARFSIPTPSSCGKPSWRGRSRSTGTSTSTTGYTSTSSPPATRPCADHVPLATLQAQWRGVLEEPARYRVTSPCELLGDVAVDVFHGG